MGMKAYLQEVCKIIEIEISSFSLQTLKLTILCKYLYKIGK